MMKQYLAQRGQAGGTNVRVPEQSSNPKHSLQKCTWSEPGTNVTMNRTIEDILEQTDCEPQNGHSISHHWSSKCTNKQYTYMCQVHTKRPFHSSASAVKMLFPLLGTPLTMGTREATINVKEMRATGRGAACAC